jgi:hypothetical protein
VVLSVLEDIQADLSKIKAAIKSRIPGCISSSGSLSYVKSLVLHVSHEIFESFCSNIYLSQNQESIAAIGSGGNRCYDMRQDGNDSLLTIQRVLDVLSIWSISYSFQEALHSSNVLWSTMLPFKNGNDKLW